MDRTRVAVSTGFLLQGFTFAALVTQTPRLQDRFDLGEGDVTVLLVLVAVVAGFGSVLAGVLATRRSSGSALTTSLVGIGAGAALVGWAPSYPLLVAAFAVYGVALGGVDATMNMQGVRVEALRGRSVMTGFHACWSIGGIAGAGYAALGLPLDAGLSVAAAVVVALAVASARHLAPDAPGSQVDDLAAAATIPVPWRPVLVFGLVICLFYAADTGTGSWSAVYLRQALGAASWLVPLGYAAYQVGALVSRLLGDQLVRRVGASRVVAGGAFLGVVGFAVVLAAPVAVLAVPGFLVAGLGIAVIAPLAFAAVGAAVPPEAADAAIARMNIANYVGAILGGAVIGAVAQGGWLRVAFLVPLVLVAPILLLSRAFDGPRATRVG
ncbi:MAG: MFS transporter [Propionibacteriales bacterium]|nr:MFS transporter [Propionibacteriales bacterium]